MKITKVENLYQHAICVYLRTVIFTQGQNVPVELEIEHNEDEAVYFIGEIDKKPVATARYRVIDGSIAKIERVGVLGDFRGKGYGKLITQYAIDDAKQAHNLEIIKLSSQDSAIPFYERLGFTVDGDGFMEAGISHHIMIMKT